MAKTREFKILAWVPTKVKEIEEELDDREKLFCWLIYVLHKQQHPKHRKSDTVYHLAHSDLVNILGWTSFMYKYNEKLESLRKIFRMGQMAGYWEIQFKEETMSHLGNPPGKTSPKYDWIYLTDPHAIALHYYIQAKMTNEGGLLSDWHTGQDMSKFYEDSVLKKATYDILKLRKHVYHNNEKG